MSYAEEIGALYLETSAKDDTNVQDIFVKLSKSIILCPFYTLCAQNYRAHLDSFD